MSHPAIKLTYQPYSSILNPGFWQQLTNIKLNKLKLDPGPVDITGTYSLGLSNNLPCLASFDHGSFSNNPQVENRTACPMYGRLMCLNIMQEMIDFNKKGHLESIGNGIWESICDGSALTHPEKHLSRFCLLVYADLKKYIYTYWFAFPALNYPKDVYYQNSSIAENRPQNAPIFDYFGPNALKMFQEQCDQMASDRSFDRGYFVVVHNELEDTVLCLSLVRYKLAQEEFKSNKVYFAFSDPCSNKQHPGWPLRNFLALIAVQYRLDKINIIRVRRGQPTSEHKSDYHHSLVLHVNYELDEICNRFPNSTESQPQCPLVTGWEKNESQQLAPKRVNLSNLLDPTRLAEDAVNLNLKLMKWRLLPRLDLEKIADTRCLLLGCGTLGCHIARGLIAWGIKHISLVDNSKISYSNPVRQTLYTFEDGLKKMFKAEAAAACLKRIHPSIDVQSYVLSIPMPGHHVVQNELEQTKRDVEQLESLIENHHAVFLLMDTRESRWLPTVIAMSKQKLIINAAIGFDTFLLQRFGVRHYDNQEDDLTRNTPPGTPEGPSHKLGSDKLGCYFCNDIVAPGDSTLDRTLDQQCTVSRPGVSMMVSAMAVEFLASIVSSPLGPLTPAPLEISKDPSSVEDETDIGSELGIVPHSIRGNMSRYHIYMPTSPCFNKCSACSTAVVRSYMDNGFEFLYRVFNEPTHLEEIAGLKDLKNVSDDVWALDSDEMPTDDCISE